jgi:hypothetical protein
VIFIKRKSLLGAALCALFFVVLGGCKTDEIQPIDSRLVGDWTNDKTDTEPPSKDGTKNFTVFEDGSFECSINPDSMGRGTVTGKLSAEGDEYIMSSLKETTGKGWGVAVGGFNGSPAGIVQIEFPDGDNDTFKFTGSNETVTDYFGGTYYRLP